VQYTAVNEKGEQINFSEAQVVADLLKRFQDLSQIMIGEAIHISELIKLLEEKDLSHMRMKCLPGACILLSPLEEEIYFW